MNTIEIPFSETQLLSQVVAGLQREGLNYGVKMSAGVWLIEITGH